MTRQRTTFDKGWRMNFEENIEEKQKEQEEALSYSQAAVCA